MPIQKIRKTHRPAILLLQGVAIVELFRHNLYIGAICAIGAFLFGVHWDWKSFNFYKEMRANEKQQANPPEGLSSNIRAVHRD